MVDAPSMLAVRMSTSDFRRPIDHNRLNETFDMLRPLVWSAIVITMLSSFSIQADAESATLPSTPKKPVTDTYQGVQVVDDYRWLENGGDPTVRQWAEAQNKLRGRISIRFAARTHCMRD